MAAERKVRLRQYAALGLLHTWGLGPDQDPEELAAELEARKDRLQRVARELGHRT